jgi:uncharacterized cupin superfamily protein
VINVFDDEWQEGYPQPDGWRANWKRVKAGMLAMSVYELLPGQTQCPYHFHHGNDELLVVLTGTPTLRTPDGERELQPGDAVPFPAGSEGAHQVYNRTEEPVRYVIAARHVTPEVVEYPDSGKLAAMAYSESHRGGPWRHGIASTTRPTSSTAKSRRLDTDATVSGGMNVLFG